MLDKPKPALAPKTPPDIRPPEAPSPPKLSSEANLDRLLHAWQSRFTAGRSPSTLGLAFSDWAVHAMNTQFQTAALARTAMAQWQRLAHTAMGGGKAIAPLPGDRRFAHRGWQQRPYDLLTQAVLLGEEWWDNIVRSPGGVDPHNRRIVAFTVRQWLDLMSPSNVPWLNPEVIEATRNTGGANLSAGMRNFLRDEAAGSPASTNCWPLRPPLRRSTSWFIDDVGALAPFLASDGARHITGTIIPVDGGQHLIA